MASQSGGSRHYAQILSAAGLAILGSLCSIYIVSQFLRSSVGVIAPNLADEIGLSASDLGLLSSAFFFAFAAAQLPLGVAIDRFGPKSCILACAAFIVVGSVFFALAMSTTGLVFARMLLGLGSASFFMAPLALYARWFAPQRFSTLTGIHLGVGSLGTLLATAPLAFAAAAAGWRAVFFGVAVITIVIAANVGIFVRDDPPGRTASRRNETFRQSVAGVVDAMRIPSVGRLFLVHLSIYSSFLLIVGLWGAPYLTHHYGYDLKGRGELLFVPALMQMFGSFFWGPMDRVFAGHKLPVLLGSAGTLATLVALATFGTIPEAALWAAFAILGFSSAVTPVLVAHGKSLFPAALLGRGITLLNLGTMGGVFLSQLVSGVVIDLFPSENGVYPLEAYRTVFGLQAVFLLAACIAYAGADDPAARKS
jgi:MFS family permease